MRHGTGCGLMILLFCGLGPAQTVKIAIAPDTLLRTRLESGLVRKESRQAQIAALFTEVGCVPEEQQLDRHSGNVICTLPGASLETIVVGGHFDYAERGTGVLDDWSGSALLASLFQSLKNIPRHHTYVFIAFAAEEAGLKGSRKYVGSLSPEQKKAIVAFVNLECLGAAGPKVWSSHATPVLLTKLEQVARSIAIPLEGVNVENIGVDDSSSFRAAKIPVLTLHSVTQQTLHLLHSTSDNLSAIRMEDYSAAYKLAAYYLAFLDETPIP